MCDQTGHRQGAYVVDRVSTELELCLQRTSDTVPNFCLSDGRSLHIAFLPPCTNTSFRRRRFDITAGWPGFATEFRV
jgi:hypothetical protein